MDKDKILIIDPIHESALKELEKDYRVEYFPAASHDEVLSRITDASILIVRSGHNVGREMLENVLRLRLVVRAGSGYENIDTYFLDEKGIKHCNLPGVNSEAVAELVMGFVFALSRNIPNISMRLKNNIWEKEKCYGIQVSGKTMGIIGYGSIGMKIAERSKGVGMHVIASASNLTTQRVDEAMSNGVTLETNDDVLEQADYICIAVPLNKETANLINMNKLKKMKSSAFLINVSRGAVVNEKDLVIALSIGIIKGAALDVFQKEKEYSPLFELDNVICTPHIGAMTIEAQEVIAKRLCDIIRENSK